MIPDEATRPACVVLSGKPFARGHMAGYMNPEHTHYDIIATGTEEEMMSVAGAANYGGDA